jgi:hypothetical protein
MSKCQRCQKIKIWDGPPEFAPVDGYCSCMEDLQAKVEELEKAEARLKDGEDDN